MLFIQNISKKRVICGDHMSPAKMDCDLIQITGAATFPPKPGMEYFFKRIAHFDFEDSTDIEDGAINEEQAQAIVKFLKEAKELNHNVVVHCFAGIRRSGAVVEFAVKNLGFQAYPEKREPNPFMLEQLNKFKNI